RAAFLAAQDVWGNPSSVHAEGRAARRLVEEARENVARLVGAETQNVVFTSGGTEANMLALASGDGTRGRRFDRLLVSSVEHPSVRSGGRFPAARVEKLPVSADGLVDLEALARRLGDASGQGPVFASVMVANNESGVVQPVADIADLVRQAGGLLHADAVQAVG